MNAPNNFEADCFSSQWEAAFDDLGNLVQLQADWDGEGAAAVRAELIPAAFRFLESVRTILPAPRDVYVAPDGTILIEWHLEGMAAVANIRDTSRVEVVYRRPGREPTFVVSQIAPSDDASRTCPVRESGDPISYLDEGAYDLAA